MPLVDKIGSDISSSEDELLTGEEPRRSPAQPDREQDNLNDDQVCNHPKLSCVIKLTSIYSILLLFRVALGRAVIISLRSPRHVTRELPPQNNIRT